MMEWLNKLSPQQRAIADKVAAEADRQGVPRELALAAAMQESGFDQRKKSKTGPVGVMQLGRAAAADLGVNRYNLDQNIRGGVSYLKQNLAQQKGDPQRALIAYHDGPSSDFFKGGSMSPEAYNHLKMVRSYGGFQGDVIPMATKPENTNTGVSIADIEPIPDIPMFSQPQETPGFGNAADIGSAGAGALTGMFTAPSVRKQAEINRSLIQAANASNVPINEANAANMQQYNDELAQRKRLLDAITEAQKSGGVPGYVESQLQGGAEDVVSRDPRVISNRTAQAVIPEYESGNTRAQAVNRGELVSDPNRFAGLSVPRTDLAPPGPTPQQLVAQQLGPEPTRPVPHQLNVPQVQPIRSMAAQGAATGALTGFNALKAAEGIHSDDPVKALLGSVGAVSGGLANQSRNPRTAMLAGTLSAISGAAGHGLDMIRGQKKPQDKSVLNKAEGGLASLPKYAGRDPKGQLVGAAVKKGKELIGRESPSLFVPRQTQIMRMSEALGPHEGKYLGLTQTDNFGVHGGRMGGNQFPNFQNISPKHQEAGVVWMNDAQKHANDLVKGRRFNNKDVVYSTYIGGPDQLKSNKTVFNDILDAHYNRELTPEQYDLINQRIATLRKAPDKPLVFSQPFDIRDKFAVQELGGDTFEKRSALASMLGAGDGVGKTKGGIALPQYQDILRAHRDPLTEGVPTSSVGTRLFTVDDIPAQFSTEFHPDYNWAVFGKDQGVQFNPVPQRIAVPDWHGNYKARFPNKEPHGNAWFNYPKNPQFIDERYLTNMQKEGYAEGGLVHLQSGGNPKLAALKAMATPMVDRLNMHFKDVTKRIPQLQDAAQRMKNGEPVTREEYELLVNAYKPVKPFAFVPKPATKEEAINALTADKKGLFGAPSQILQPGQNVGLRLDIPAYSDHGVWVPAVHEKGTKAGAGTRVGYESVASVNNPVFNMSDKGALSIASGKPKSTIATIEGGWNPVDEQTAIANAQRYLEHPDWRQVGMDPERHGYFYDRASMEPVLSAEEALQIGPLVLARKPVYGKKEDFGFAEGGLVNLQAGGNPKAAAMKALAKQFAPKISAETKPGWAGTVEPMSVGLQTEKGLPFEMRRDWPGKYSFSVDGKDAGAINYVKSPIGEWNPNIMVHPDFQRQGIANSVYDFLEQNVIKQPFSSSGGQSEMGRAFREARQAKKETPEFAKGGQVGLYANIHAKRERIKQGSGEKMRKPGSEGAPTADAFRESAKTAKRK